MKKQKRFMMLLVGVLLMLVSMGIKAQPSYSTKITGATQVACNMFEFDLMIQRTGTTVLQLAMYQLGVNINPAIIPAGAQVNMSMVPGSSALSTNMKPTPDRFSFDASKNCLIMTAMSPAYANRTTITNAPAGVKVARIRVTCSQPWNPGIATNPAWAWAMTSGYQTKVFAYIGTTNTDITNQASHYLVAPFNLTLNNSSSVVPAVSSISTDLTEVCTNPGNGATITVDNTTNYCSYYLYRNGVQLTGPGAVAYGTGSGPVSFGYLQTDGVFTVKSPSCTGMVDMSNDVTVVGLTPLVQTISISPDPASVPSGDITFTTTTQNSAPGNWFDWFVNGVNQLVYDPTFTYTPVSGDVVYADVNSDGSMCISIASQLAVSQSVPVYVGPDPIKYDVTGTTSICAGATTPVTLANSQTAFSYQLYKDNVATGAPQAGSDGNALTWTVGAAGVYTVKTVLPVGFEMNLAATITVNPILTSTFTQVPPICAGSALADLPTVSNNGISGTWAPAMNNMLTTLYTFTPAVGQCGTVATMTIVVNQKTVPTFTQVPAICAGATLAPLPTLSNNGIPGAWTPALDNMLTTEYTFTPSTGQCATTQTMTIVVNQPTVPTFTQIDPICAGGTITLPTTSLNAITGVWTPGVNNNLTTEYTFTPTTGQCATTAVMTVVVNQPTVPTFTQIDPICAGGTISLPVLSNNGIAGAWTPAVDNNLTTLYTFTPTTGQCATTATMTVVVNQPTVPTFTQVDPICAGATLDPLPLTSLNGVAGTWAPALDNMNTTLYTFTPTTGLCATTASMTIVVNPVATPTFTQVAPICAGATLDPLPTSSLEAIAGTWAPAINNMATTLYTFTPAGGCNTTATMTVVVNPMVTPTFTQVPPICAGATLDPLPTSSLEAIAGTWAPAINNMATTLYTFTPAGGCYSTATMTIVVNPLGTPTFTQVAPICAGATLDPLPTSSLEAIAGTWAPAINNMATTLYTFTPAGGCNTTATMTIVVNPLGTPTFTQVAPICAGATLDPLPTSSLEAIVGTWAPAINNMATTEYTFTPAGGCNTTATMTIVVNPLGTPTFTQVAPICAGAPLSPLPTSSLEAIVGTWAPAINNMATTLYTFTPAGGCNTPATMTIVVNPLVTPTFTQVAPICAGTALSALPTSSLEAIVGTWAPAINNMATTLYTFTPAGGCYTTATMTIVVNQPVTPTFTPVAAINDGDPLAPLPTTSLNGITGTWAPAMNNHATTLYTFTPAAGQCANNATMIITVNPLVNAWVFNGDIGTTIQVYWPSIATAVHYAFQYRPTGTPGTGGWIGVSTNTNTVKLGNLTPGLPYDIRVKGYLANGSPVAGMPTNHFTTTPTTYSKDMDMGTTLRVLWDDYSPWASGYTVQYKKVGAPSWSVLPVGNMPIVQLATEPGANYLVQVVVYHAGSLWGTTAPYAFTANSYSYSVTNKTGATLDLTWTDFNLNNPAPWVVTQYLRYRVAGSTGVWIQKTVAGGINTYHLTGLALTTNYEFQVHVYQPAFWGSTPLGTFSTSLTKNTNADITNNSINIYPNPFVDKVNMDLFTEQGTTVTWKVYDMTGKVVLSGSESITSGSSTLNIDGANLPKGVYMLNAIMDDQMQSFRILKQ